MNRSGGLVVLLLALLLLGCTGFSARYEMGRAFGPEPPALLAAGWADLPGWESDGASEALVALGAQCAAGRAPAEPTGMLVAPERLGSSFWWRALCTEAAQLAAANDAAARAFLAAHFQPALVVAGGLLSGYFEPVYPACGLPAPGCQAPVRAPPPGLVDVDARRIDPEAPARRIRGCLEEGVLAACPGRAAIEAGAMPDAPVLAWMDVVDKFFLQIQGSGRLALADGRELRVGYGAQNGAPYVPIGRVLLDRGAIRRPVSMQAIRAWLAANRDHAEEVLNANPAYVFFRPIDLPGGVGPLGSLGVPLTAGRSVAVDAALIPLGLPLYLAPGPQSGVDVPPPRLVLAQDTGGAIRGAARVDLFLGTGAAAGEVAGRLAAPLRLWLLLPRLDDDAREP